MSDETLKSEYERFKEECIKLTTVNSELEVQNAELKNTNERLMKIIENLSEKN